VSLVELAMKRREAEQLQRAEADPEPETRSNPGGRKGLAKEYACPRCGRRTTSVRGFCCRCRSNLPDPRTLDNATLVAHLAACRVELKRRQDEIAAALEAP
jgi:uncharacterized OB-fold protein